MLSLWGVSSTHFSFRFHYNLISSLLAQFATRMIIQIIEFYHGSVVIVLNSKEIEAKYASCFDNAPYQNMLK